MQETIPQLEEELETLVSKFVENAARARSPAMGEVARHRVFEGHQTAIVRPNGETDDTEFREFSADSEVPSDTILYSSLDEIIKCFIPVAEAMANDQERFFVEIMHQVTQKTGNVVDGGGQPLSYEKILEVLEVIEIDFDANGNPRMPTLMINPALAPRIKEMADGPSAKEFEKKLKKIIEKKRLEWREREANRTLVG
ncbi:hypothetical protein [Sagittula sp.]|uniref:hypothetical protein n=1 Tax=Sagittula sp. TaxID=2038081 RepID=UPI0035146D6F